MKASLLESTELRDVPEVEQVESKPQSKAAKPKQVLQGSAVVFPEIELWAESVEGAEVLTQLAESFTRYIILPDGAADALALWVAHTLLSDFKYAQHLAETQASRFQLMMSEVPAPHTEPTNERDRKRGECRLIQSLHSSTSFDAGSQVRAVAAFETW